jgi:hypothetical protein
MTLQFGRNFCKFLANVVFPPFVTLTKEKIKSTKKEKALKNMDHFKMSFLEKDMENNIKLF